MNVIHERAIERKVASLGIINDKDIKQLDGIDLGLKGDHQKINAALAIKLCHEWVKQQNTRDPGSIELSEQALSNALKTTSWPGRAQTLVSPLIPNITWYLDGAHTMESMSACASWFSSLPISTDEKIYLLFNCTHGRDGMNLLPPLTALELNHPFHRVLFSTNTSFSNANNQSNCLVSF